MKKAKHILLADELSDQQSGDRKIASRLLEYSFLMAKTLKLPLEILHVEDPIGAGGFRQVFKRIVNENRKIKFGIIGQLQKKFPIPVRRRLDSGDPVDRLLIAMRHKQEIKLTIVGTHGRRGLNRLLIGSVAEELIRQSPVPVMVVGPKVRRLKMPREARAPFSAVLVATDLGPNSSPAEGFARALAKNWGVPMVLVHGLYESLHPVIQTAFSSARAGADLQDLILSLKREALKVLKRKCAANIKKGVDCRYRLSDQFIPAASFILREANSGNPLVVMGTHSRNAIQVAFLGSTAKQVILNSTAPVVTVGSRR